MMIPELLLNVTVELGAYIYPLKSLFALIVIFELVALNIKSCCALLLLKETFELKVN